MENAFFDMAKEMKEKSRKMKYLGKEMQRELNRDLRIYINKNPEKVLFYQRQQLFRKSVDASGRLGKPLGKYAWSTDMFSGGKKTYNTPYTMVDSGRLRDSLDVEFKYNQLIFSADHDAVFDNEVFKGLQLLGLNEDSTRRMMNNVFKPFVSEWIRVRLSQL